MAQRINRTPAEWQALIDRVAALNREGITTNEACKQLGLNKGLFYLKRSKLKKAPKRKYVRKAPAYEKVELPPEKEMVIRYQADAPMEPIQVEVKGRPQDILAFFRQAGGNQ